MKTKKEQLKAIRDLQKKAMKLLNKPDKTRKDGALCNKMFERVIKMEDLYEKRFGVNPSREYGTWKK